MQRARVVLVLALTVLAGCQTGGRFEIEDHPEYDKLQPEIARLVVEVKRSEGAPLYATLQELVAYDVFAVEKVAALLDEPNARLRSNALWVLWQIQDAEYVDVQDDIDRCLEESVDDPDRLVRLEAASGLVNRNRWKFIPVLIDGLVDDDPAVRYSCHATLRETTSQNFGYQVDLDPEGREQAVSRWREWYEVWSHSGG